LQKSKKTEDFYVEYFYDIFKYERVWEKKRISILKIENPKGS